MARTSFPRYQSRAVQTERGPYRLLETVNDACSDLYFSTLLLLWWLPRLQVEAVLS